MKKWCFYSKVSSTQEKISCGYYSNKAEATEGFASMKSLDLNTFNRLFEVKLYE